jgi:hypothetical protein
MKYFRLIYEAAIPDRLYRRMQAGAVSIPEPVYHKIAIRIDVPRHAQQPVPGAHDVFVEGEARKFSLVAASVSDTAFSGREHIYAHALTDGPVKGGRNDRPATSPPPPPKGQGGKP